MIRTIFDQSKLLFALCVSFSVVGCVIETNSSASSQSNDSSQSNSLSQSSSSIQSSYSSQSSSTSQIDEDALSATTLAERYAKYFKVGAAVDGNSYRTHSGLLQDHFNSITAENAMKFGSLHPSEYSFNFGLADDMVAFAEANDMAVRGHALVWHRQTPGWVFSSPGGGAASREQVLSRMQSHINQVVGRYKGRIYAWDVVNEAFMDDGSFRTHNESANDQKSPWYGALGTSYIAEAFKYAHQADPDAKLFYNDYYNYLPDKANAIYEMLKGLIEDGVPVHGVGLQCHINIQSSPVETHQSFMQSVENLERSIQLYASLGLDVEITELDVSLYIGGIQYSQSNFYTVGSFTDEIEQQQAERYAAFFEMFRRNRDVITNVTFWGIADDNTWLSEFSSGRQDFPMLFDVNHQPKKAFDSVMNFTPLL